MRLLNVHTLEFDEFSSALTPPYVILSHRWERNEATFQDVLKRRKTENAGYQKVQSFATYVKDNVPSVDWIWIDTCCIDKKNSVELEYAINSMFQWYRESRICLAYLSDVTKPNDDAAFRASLWFRRGWTLQELLAPRTVVFLSRDWHVIGHKGIHNSSLCTGPPFNSIIETITGIPEAVLRDYNECRVLSTGEKFKWIKDRHTTREEDLAYCLLGLFEVSMGIRYGGVDAGKKAMDRLRAKIRKGSDSTPVMYQNAWQPQNKGDEEEDYVSDALYGMSRSDGMTDHKIEDTDPPVSAQFVHSGALRGHSDIQLVSPQSTPLANIWDFGNLADRLDEIAGTLMTFHGTTKTLRAFKRFAFVCERLSAPLRMLESFLPESVADVVLLMSCIQAHGRHVARLPRTIENLETAIAQYKQNEHTCMIYSDSKIESWLSDLEHFKTSLHFAIDVYFDKRRDGQLMSANVNTKTSTTQFSTASQCKLSSPEGSRNFSVALTNPPDRHEARSHENDTSGALGMRRSHDRYDSSPESRLGKRRACKQILHASVRWSWLSSSIWNIAITRAQCGWDVHLRAYNEVGYDAKIFKLCKTGDIDGIQRLVATGAASLQDRIDGDETLLQRATIEGHHSLCKYLLSEMTTTERMEEMTTALGYYAHHGSRRDSAQVMYRLFIEEYDLDVDLDLDPENPPVYTDMSWWMWCPSKECQGIILNNMALPWSKLSTDERFKRAAMAYAGSPRDLLQLSGLQPYDSRLISLRDMFGYSALHHMAVRLADEVRTSLHDKTGPAKVQEWVRFGTDLLKTGLDPHYFPPHRETALLRCMQRVLPDWFYGRPFRYHELQKVLHVWLTFVMDSGLNPRVYVQRENAVLRNMNITASTSSILFEQEVSSITLAEIEYSDDPTMWSVKVLEASSITVRHLIVCPGSFNPATSVSQTICWQPDKKELREGDWVSVKTFEVRPASIDTRERSSTVQEPFVSLVEGTQDDAGVVMRLSDYDSRQAGYRSRSHSSPPSMLRRKEAYSTARTSTFHPWLAAYHLCLRDSRYRSGCEGFDFVIDTTQVQDYRACAKSTPRERSSIQDTWNWKLRSFLYEIDACQMQTGSLRRNKRLPWNLRHNYAPDCPQGCSQVHLNRISGYKSM